ncbi:MAG: alpha/beta hydrolase [Balneolaceae bacterium]
MEKENQKNHPLKKAGLYLLMGIAGYLFTVGMLTILQNQLLFHPSKQLVATPDDLNLSWSEHAIETADGETLHAWYLHQPDAEFTVVFTHGNAGNISGRLDISRTIMQAGASVFLYDYRGYGLSSGSPSENGLYRDADAVVDYLRTELGVKPEQTVYFGRSLGGVFAAYKAADYGGAGLVLDSSFISLEEIAADLFPFIPSFLLRGDYATASFVEEAGEMPLLILHSRDDELIGYRHGQTLYERASGPKNMVTLSGGHNENYWMSIERFASAWEEFLSSLQNDSPS